MLFINLNQIEEGMDHLVGTKAYELGLLMACGVEIPHGFVVTSEGLTEYFKVLAMNDPNRMHELKELMLTEEECLEWFETAAMPEAIVKGLIEMIDPNARYAVRSSSSLEDLEGISFEGQYKTVLNVEGVENIERAMKACWASIWNERLSHYKISHHIENHEASPLHAILIQEMVIGEVSGIAFSANPVNGKRDEATIDATWGLCEGVVDGLVASDHIQVDACKMEIVDYDVREKPHQVVDTLKGIDTIPVEEDKINARCISDEEILALVDQMEKIADFFGMPTDIEWTIRKEKFYILQARPLTTLLPLPDPSRDSCRDPVHIYVDFNTVSQGVKEPMTPIGQETLNYYFREAFSLLTGKVTYRPKWLTYVKGRLYVDLTVFMGRKRWWKRLADRISLKDPLVGKELLEVMARYEDALKHSDVKFRLPVKMPYRMARHLYFPMIKGFLKGRRNPEQAMAVATSKGEETLKKVQGLFEEAETPKTILNGIRKAAPIMMTFSFVQYSYCAYGFEAMKKAEKAIDELKLECDVERIRRAMPTNPTTLMGHEMIGHAVYFSAHSEERLDEKHPRIVDFLMLYGHRGNVEMDIGTPRWREEPDTVIKMIKGYMNASNLEKLYKNMKDEEHLAVKEIEKIQTAIAEKRGKRQVQKVTKWLNTYRQLAGGREQPKFDLMRMNDVLRRQLLRMGEMLVEQGKIDTAGDVVFLYEADILNETLSDLRPIVEENRILHQHNETLYRLPPIMTSIGECIYGSSDAEHGHLGHGVAPGQAVGRIRKLMKPDAAFLEKGDIILTYATNPSWTPLFILAGGLVMESGGILSHGSIVAREYGIPAVVLPGATELLIDGQLVRVDGNTGRVEALSD